VWHYYWYSISSTDHKIGKWQLQKKEEEKNVFLVIQLQLKITLDFILPRDFIFLNRTQ
jgi:hypothetical protein